jgi:hypothetical protein
MIPVNVSPSPHTVNITRELLSFASTMVLPNSSNSNSSRVGREPYDPFADLEPSWISITKGGHYKLMVGEQDYIYLKQVTNGLFKVGLLLF